MKILIAHGCTVFDNIGGSEVQLNYISEFLRKKGHSVFFYTNDYTPELPDFQIINNFKTYRNNSINNVNMLMPYNHINKIADIIKSENIDIIFARSIRLSFILYKTSKKAGIPFVYQLPSEFNAIIRKRLDFFTNIHKNINENLLNSILYKKYFYKADKVLTVSKQDAEQLSNYYNINAHCIYNMHPIPPVLNDELKLFSSVSSSVDDNRPKNIVWINNIKPLKRPEWFIELANKFSDVKNVKFLMAGKMPNSDYGKEIRNRINKTKNIEYLGLLSFDQCNELLKNNAMLSIITSTTEGFSNVSIQSWMNSIPIITTIDKDNIVENNKLGFAVKTIDELEEKVKYFLNNPSEVYQFKKRAREYALKYHDFNSNGPQYEKLFNNLINKKSQ